MNQVLCHYGIKGMKWGVRRTPEQLGHPRKKMPVNVTDIERDRLLKMLDSGKDFVMREGETLYRVTQTEGVEKGRVYVSARKPYSISDLEQIGANFYNNIYLKEYETKRNSKVAGVDTQFKTLSDLTQKGREELENDPEIISILSTDTPLRSKYIQRLKEKGYEYVYDLEDGYKFRWKDLPMVVLDSEASLSTKNVKLVYDYFDGEREY